MLNKKIVSVLAVTLMLTMGIGFAFVGNDESKAVWNDTSHPVQAEINMTASAMWTAYQNGATTYYAGYHTWVSVTSATSRSDTYWISAVSTNYGASDTAGLTISNYDDLTGYINKDTSGEIYLTLSLNDGGDTTDNTVTIIVADMHSSNANLWNPLNLPANVFEEWGNISGNEYYAEVGANVSIAWQNNIDNIEYTVTGVTAGYGLSVASDSLTGMITQAGTITVEITVDQGGDPEPLDITIIAIDNSHADVRMIGGETWTYTPTTNMTSVLSISGTATSWVSLTSGTVSGTAPTNTSVGQTYDLTITASTSDPNQNVTQTVTFTVDPQITLTAPATYTVSYGTDVADILASNFQGGGRSIYSITGGTATGFSVGAVNGAVEWANPTSGTVIFTATSPYTYTSGATNTASATMDVTVTGILTASVSGTLYLVTGKVVPNTPAEAVTLSHNNVGTGTYTWAVVGTNNSGVTVASDGTLGGTPGNVGTYAVTVRCTSVVGSTTQTADTTLNIVIVQVLAFTSMPSQGTVR